MSAFDPQERVRERESLSNALHVLRRRWLIVVWIVLAAVVVMVVTHERRTKSYSATSNVAFQSGTLSGPGFRYRPRAAANHNAKRTPKS